MKNSLFLLGAAAVVALSSCTKNEVLEVAENRAIGFDSFVGNPTKGVVTNDLFKSFNVFGGFNDFTHVFNNVTVTKGDLNWTVAEGNEAYWQEGKTYTFMGYSGETAKTLATATANGVAFTGYTVDPSTQKDLLVSEVSKTEAITKGYDKPVPMTFRHVLSMMKFTFASEMPENIKITVSDLTVTDLPNKGDYTYTKVNKGTWNLVEPSTNKASYTVAYANLIDINNTTGKESGEIIVMPQNVSGIKVNFTVTVTGGLDFTKSHSITLPNIELLEGNRYNFTATFDGENIDPDNPMKPIEFTVSVLPGWNNADGGNATVNTTPGN